MYLCSSIAKVAKFGLSKDAKLMIPNVYYPEFTHSQTHTDTHTITDTDTNKHTHTYTSASEIIMQRRKTLQSEKETDFTFFIWHDISHPWKSYRYIVSWGSWTGIIPVNDIFGQHYYRHSKLWYLNFQIIEASFHIIVKQLEKIPVENTHWKVLGNHWDTV